MPNEPERPLNTFYAFCSLFLPGLGQLLQKRIGAAIGFFTPFILTGIMPVIIVTVLFVGQFPNQPPWIYVLHILVFGGVCIPFMLAVFCSVLDAAAWKQGDRTRFQKPLFIFAALYFIVVVFLLLPSIPSAREAARRMQCSNNIKQIALAFYNYEREHGHFPPAYTVDEDGKPLHSWRVLILPYIKQNALYEKIRLDEPWDSEYNQQFHLEVPSVFRCPRVPREDFQCQTCFYRHISVPGGCSYSIIDGAEAAFTGSIPREGLEGWDLAATIFLVERRTPVNWMDPSSEISFETACKGVNIDGMGIGSWHPGGAHVGMGDGSVRFMTNNVSGDVLRDLLTVGKRRTL